ncbi:MAG: hypothetical protein DRO40_09005 [Thermoprotei archaeon]|nr:MAG: hypothetical protein DRO40_09005 [Thermoprotei archaeon]
MFLSRDDIIRVLGTLIEDLRSDFIETQRDEYIMLRREIYNNYYKVSPFSINNAPQTIAFVDGGFKPYQLDVSIIIPLQIGAYIRVNDDRRLKTVKEVLDIPVTDNLLLYSSRRRRGSKYVFKIRIKSFQKTGLLFDKDNPDDEVSNKINTFLLEFSGLSESRSPKFFVKLTKYIEGLLELAYTIKLLMKTEEESLLDQPLSYAVLDGTLIKWFSIKTQKKLKGIDGLDILSAILNTEPEKIKKYLYRVVGLAKTTKFTNIIRGQILFLSKTSSMKHSRGAYTMVNTEALNAICDKLNNFLDKYPATDFVLETLHLLNRIVYNLHNIYVARFPITTDYNNIFMIDIHLDKPIIWMNKKNKVEVNISQARNVNPYLSYIVNTLYYHRTSVPGEPPYGYMEVDGLVRLSESIRSLFENTLISVLRRYDDLTSRILIQVFSPTTRMRYGYR